MFNFIYNLFKKKDNVQYRELGWVNIYTRGDGKCVVSNVPKKTREEAIMTKTTNPVSKYKGTKQIFIK